MRGHIDKLSKNIGVDINSQPVGAVQWDFIASIPGAEDSMVRNYEAGPECIFLFLTSRCSRGCPSCQVAAQHLDPQDIDYLLTSQKGKRLSYVILDGDPFLHPFFNEIVALIEKSGLSYSVNSFSAPDPSILDVIKGKACKVQFKMSSVDPSDTYVRKIVDALEICRKNDIYTAIIFSLTADNYSRTGEFISFCRLHGVKQFSFFRLAYCHLLPPALPIPASAYLEVSKYLLKQRKEIKETHVTSNDALWKGCGACCSSMAVMPNGDIMPCAYLPISVGNIREHDIERAWKSSVFNKIRRSELDGKCGQCKYKFMCKGCRALPYNSDGNYLGEDRGCWL